MSKKKLHRVSVYIMDPERKRVLLQRSTSGAFASKFMPPSALLNDRQTPLETIRSLMTTIIGEFDFYFLGHGPAMPCILDENSIKIYPPLHVQVTAVDDETLHVDYVYLAQSKNSYEFINDDSLGWFNPANMKHSPPHIRQVVYHILGLMN